MDWRHMGELLKAGQAVFSELKNLCVWNKTNGGMGSFYRSKHELVCVFKIGEAPHGVNSFGLQATPGHYRTNVWDYPGISSLGRSARQRRSPCTPPVKPTALAADAIRDCSKRGAIVLDSFRGLRQRRSSPPRVVRAGREADRVSIHPHIATAIIPPLRGLNRQALRSTGGEWRGVRGRGERAQGGRSPGRGRPMSRNEYRTCQSRGLPPSAGGTPLPEGPLGGNPEAGRARQGRSRI